jgi:AcrR family transcriptional regulator
MQVARSKKAEKRDETHTRLVEVGRALFSEKGFAATGTEEIVAAAGVTRGALYFHFADKTELFAVVMDRIAREVAAEVERAGRIAEDPLQQLKDGTNAYIDACCDPTRRQVYLVDGRSVLGHRLWHDIENRYALPLLYEGVSAALAAHPIPGMDTEALTVLLGGAMVEAAGWLGASDDMDAVRARAHNTFNLILDRLFAGA